MNTTLPTNDEEVEATLTATYGDNLTAKNLFGLYLCRRRGDGESVLQAYKGTLLDYLEIVTEGEKSSDGNLQHAQLWHRRTPARKIMKTQTNIEAGEAAQTKKIPAVAPVATCSPVGALIVFAAYTVIYEAMIWGIFGWAVFINGSSGWWVLVAIFCSASQLKPKHFGIKVSEENASLSHGDESATPQAR